MMKALEEIYFAVKTQDSCIASIPEIYKSKDIEEPKVSSILWQLQQKRRKSIYKHGVELFVT